MAAAARFRGSAAGAFTAALAVAAHGLGDGGAPAGGSLALLAVLAVGIGALVATWERAARRLTLLGVLAGGQLAGHLALSIGGHHGSAAAPVSMVTLHVVAVITGALLVTACERLFRLLSTVVSGSDPTGPLPAVVPLRTAVIRGEHPSRRELLLAASISHRGPPARIAC